MNRLEHILAEEYSKNKVYFTGNGTTALYLIFKALGIQNKKVLFPNITCMTPVNAAIYAGYEVVFCDVKQEDFTMDIESLRSIIKKEDIGIVVPTHIYGHICDMKKIYEICNKENIIVVEDCAQTSYISEYNDFAITSFGHTKLFETQSGGGAIFYNNEIENKLDKYAIELNDTNDFEEFRGYTSEYYRITKELQGKEYYSKMKDLQINSRNIFLRHFKNNDELIEILKTKKNVISKRNNRIELYKTRLNKEKFIYPKIEKNSASSLWRLSILLKDMDRDKFIQMVRESNVDISTWYPCLHRFYSSQSDCDFGNSIEIEKNIVNLWITEKYSEHKIKEDIDKINSIITRNFS